MFIFETKACKTKKLIFLEEIIIKQTAKNSRDLCLIRLTLFSSATHEHSIMPFKQPDSNKIDKY